ncbi:uncharacterized protein LOC144662923 [Oculina patagonica]
MQSSLQPSSLPTYKRTWVLFNQFLHDTFQCTMFSLPIPPPTLALFIAYLFNRHYAPSTVNTLVSALGYSHKLAGFPDPGKVFYIVQTLKGYHKIGHRLDCRLPITLNILHRLLDSASHIAGSQYQITLFRAMCSLAFFAFLRVGEITATGESSSPLQIHQLSKLLNPAKEVFGLKITFQDFKHNYNQRPFSLVLNRQDSHCPVQLLLDYLALRGNAQGPIFLTILGTPVPRVLFGDLLCQAIKYCGLDPSRYKGHSFRIGAASYAADRGFSDAQIRIQGRWKSNAFLKYIRLSTASN